MICRRVTISATEATALGFGIICHMLKRYSMWPVWRIDYDDVVVSSHYDVSKVPSGTTNPPLCLHHIAIFPEV